jgi:uncharacterized membrane protein YjjB (DUF3815 family)
MWDLLDPIIDLLAAFISERRQRLYACLLLSAAAAGLMMWLAPNFGLKTALAVIVVGLGISIGIAWERRSR